MRKNTPKTSLLSLLRELTVSQRLQLASDAGTAVSYLYALASCQRCACSAALALQLELASEQMHERTAGQTAIVTMRELATMCAGGAK